MCVSSEEVSGVVQNVWQTMLGLETSPVDADPFSTGARVFTASIQITGEWQGAVTLSCPEQAVRQAGTAMFCTPEDELSDEDMRDTLNELVNIIGGNIKDMVPGPGYLSLPTIVDGERYDISIPGTALLTQISLKCGPTPILTTVFERQDA